MYDQIKQQMSHDDLIVSKKITGLTDKLDSINKELAELNEEYDKIKGKKVSGSGNVADNLIESWPIESLYDSCEIEAGRELSRATFKDLMDVTRIVRRRGVLLDELKKVEEKINFHKLEILEERINDLLSNES